MAFGITENGYENKPLETVKTEIEDDLKASIDPGINVTASSVLGQLIGVFSAAVAELWDVGEAVYAAWDPDQSTGESLDSLSSLTGTIREAATKSTVTATVNLNNGTTLPAGSQASVDGDSSAIFQTLEDVTNSSGVPADFDVEMESTETGPIVANAGTLTVIVTPVSGWNSITNDADATLGEDEETDADLRLRRVEELRATGSASVEALKADISTVADVEEVVIFENTALTTDVDGVPGKAFEAVVLGGEDADIAEQIFNSKSAGIEAYGTTTETVTDSQGFDHTIKFTRPTEKTMMVEIFTTIDADEFPSDGADQIKQAVVDRADELQGIGDDVILTKYYGAINGISGVADVTTLKFYDNATLGSEVLAETNFATHTKWSETGDWDLTAGTYALYTHSTGTGSLTQLSTDFATALTGNRWYKLQYTISNVTGSTPTAIVTTGIAHEAVTIPMTTGTQTAYVYTKASPGDFVITVTSTSAASFRFDDVTLKRITSATGNYTVGSREIALVEFERIAVVTS